MLFEEELLAGDAPKEIAWAFRDGKEGPPRLIDLRDAWHLLADVEEFWFEPILSATCSIAWDDGQPTFEDIGRMTVWIRDVRDTLKQVASHVDKIEMAVSHDWGEIAANGEVVDLPRLNRSGRELTHSDHEAWEARAVAENAPHGVAA